MWIENVGSVKVLSSMPTLEFHKCEERVLNSVFKRRLALSLHACFVLARDTLP